MIRPTVVSVMLAVSIAARCQQPAPAGEELPLDRAVSLALKNNRMVKNAALDVLKSENDLAASRTYRLPAFSFNVLETQLLTRMDFLFPKGAFGVFPGIGPVPSQETSITTARRPTTWVYARVSQPLSQLYRIHLGVGVRQLSREVARQQLEARQQDVASDVKKAYYALLQTQSALEAAAESIQLYRELDRVVGQSLAQQVALKSDSLDVKARLAKAEYDAVTLRHTLATQQEQLNNLLGRDLRTEFAVKQAPDPAGPETELAAARARALDQRPELREAKLKAQQAAKDRSMKKAEYIPDVSLNFQYVSPLGVELLPHNVMGAGLLVSWDVFDWGRKKQELASKTHTVEQARNAIEETEAQVLLDVDNRFRKLEEARALLHVVELAREAAREKVRVAKNKYEQQAALLKDVLQMESSLADVNHQHEQTLLAFWTTRADFERALGER